jgi:hypothetical protein
VIQQSWRIVHYGALNSDLNLAAAVTPTNATTGTHVVGTASLKNTSPGSRTVQVNYTVQFMSPTSGAVTVTSGSFSVTLAPGQTVQRTFAFTVGSSFPRGTYNVLVTAGDFIGATAATTTLTVS